MQYFIKILFIYFAFPIYLLSSSELSVNVKTKPGLSLIRIKNIEDKRSFFSSSYLKELKNVFEFDFNHNGRTCVSSNKHSTFEIKIAGQNKELKVLLIDHVNNQRYRYPPIQISGILNEDRRKIHAISDRIHKDLFHVEGIASTKILYSVRQKKSKDWISEIWISDYDGGNKKQITHTNKYNVSPFYVPLYTKKGFQHFLYVSYQKGQPKIYRRTLHHSAETPVFSLAGNQLLPCVSPQCDMVSFICDTSGRSDLFLQKYTTEGIADGKPIQLFSSSRATQATSTFSPDGKNLAFVSDKDGPPRIYVITIPPKGVNKKPIPTLITKRNRYNSGPSWSPDGKKLAYSAKVNGIGQIWIYDFETNEENQLTNDPINKENPKWAPDSFHLIYNTEDGNHSELYIINLNEKMPTQITSGIGQKRFPCWEPGRRKRLP